VIKKLPYSNAYDFLKKIAKKHGYKKKINLKLRACSTCKTYPKKNFLEKILYKKNIYINYPVFICEKCGLGQQTFEFDEKFHNFFYKEIISKNLFLNKKIITNNFQLSYKNGIYLNKKFNNYFQKKRTILDIGCGTAGLLKYFNKLGHITYGNEPNKNYYKFAKKFLKNIKNDNFENLDYKKNFFDVVFIMGSIEHIHNPQLVINKINRVTKKNAILIIDTKGYPSNILNNYFNFNHHRCYTKKTLNSFLEANYWSKQFLQFDIKYSKSKLNPKNYSVKNKPNKIKKGNLLGLFVKNKNRKLKFSKDNFFYKFLKNN